jgi:alkanesulfonate monooxygenase SsuD/methylene tetrahydromethanopterin reductase-like flavin-dependent oxidoreductase (luciferase family)
VEDLIEIAPEMEDLGYDSLTVTEHHFQRDGWIPTPLAVLAAVAAVTKRMTLGTNILLAPLYNPVKLAEDIAVVDNISNGRLTVGVAPGYVPEEFAGLMVPYDERVSRFLETMDVLKAAWTNEVFEHSGKHFQIPPTHLSPKPVQDPHPQIWWGVSGPRLLRLAAERGFVFTASPRHTIEEIEEHLGIYQRSAEAVGFTPPAFPVMKGVFVAETREAAEAVAGPSVTHLFTELYGKNSASGARALTNDKGELVEDENTVSFETFKERYLIGTPDDVAEKVRELRDRVGMTELIAWSQLPGINGDQVRSSMQLFAREVIPAFAD